MNPWLGMVLLYSGGLVLALVWLKLVAIPYGLVLPRKSEKPREAKRFTYRDLVEHDSSESSRFCLWVLGLNNHDYGIVMDYVSKHIDEAVPEDEMTMIRGPVYP